MIRTVTFSALAATAALGACSDPALTARVDALEAKIAEIEKGGGAAAATADDGQAKEQAAMEVYREANEAFRGGDTDKAKTLLTKLGTEFAGTRVAGAGERLLDQINVVGKSIDEIKVDEWYKGEATLADGKATMLVFWEVWCPHCKREVPKLQETYNKYHAKGLGMMGLTKLTRGKTKDEVMAFLDEQKVSYPVGKEAGDMSDFFGVSGVPAAAVVKDGKVVWRGHPAQVTDQMIEGWIGG